MSSIHSGTAIKNGNESHPALIIAVFYRRPLQESNLHLILRRDP